MMTIKFIEAIALMSANVYWLLFVLRFERKNQWSGFHRGTARAMKRFEYALNLDMQLWQQKQDKKFAQMREQTARYFSKWREEEIIFDEICKGTRPFEDLQKLEILGRKK